VPDTVHEAVRDLTRAREVAMIDLEKKRRRLSFRLRHGRLFAGGKNWTKLCAKLVRVRAAISPVHIPLQQRRELVKGGSSSRSNAASTVRDELVRQNVRQGFNR
jgi:hypothetical protein